MKDILANILKHPKAPTAIGSVSALLIVIMIALGVIGGEDKASPGNSAHLSRPLSSNDLTFTLGNPQQGQGQLWQGRINSRQFIRISPKFNARVMDVLVRPGDKLKKGDHIAKLDDRDLKATFQAAKSAQLAATAEAAQATSEEKRITDLFQKEAATRQTYEGVVAKAQAARAMAQEAASQAQQRQVLLSENDLIAPFDGVVGERFVEPGDMAIANQPIVSFYQENNFRLEAALPAQCTDYLKLHTPIPVRLETVDETLKGDLEEVAPELDPQTQTRLIKIGLPMNAKIQQGRMGWLELNCSATESVLMIPESSLIHFGQLEAVRVVDNQQWTVRHIRSGKRVRDQVEVLSGLKAGEIVITNPGVTP